MQDTWQPPAGFVGAIVYRGPSMLNGKPVVAVVTGWHGGRNSKIGADMVQLYILPDVRMTPAEAARRGHDAAACGACPLRGSYARQPGKRTELREEGSRVCYVVLGQGPHIVHGALARGVYEDWTGLHPATLAARCRGRGVRLGAYGDAAALPARIVRAIVRRAAYWTGYTHSPEAAPWLAAYAMASAHTPAHAAELQAAGWRTFRTAPAGDTARMPGELLCPASKEAGARLQCQDCRACSGTSSGRRANVMIPLHAGQRAAVVRGIVSGLEAAA